MHFLRPKIALFCLCLPFALSAQQAVADSLRQHLKTLSPKDTLYVLDLLYLWIAEGKTKPESALRSAQQALDLSRKIGWLRGEVNALNCLGLSKQRQGYYTEAIAYYLPAIELAEQSRSPGHISKTYTNVGILYQLTGDYLKALEHFRRVLAVEERAPQRAAVYNNMGIVFKNTRQIDSALAYYQAALKIHLQTQDTYGLAPIYNNIGIIQRDRGDWAAALQQFQKALQLYYQLNDRESCAVVLGSIGNVLTQIGALPAAEDTLRKAFDLAQEQGLLLAQGDISNYFQQLYARQGQYEQAFFWSKSFKTFGDSLQNIQKRDELAAIRARFESEKKVSLLEKDVALERSRRLLWTAGALGLLLLLLAAAYALRQVQRRRVLEQALQIQEIERLRAEDETRQLREEKLKEQLDFRSRELNAQTLHLVQKNELLQTVAEQLQASTKDKSAAPAQLRNLQRLVEANLDDGEQWEDFKRHFEAVHPHFFQRLLVAYPGLTAHDLRYCAYLRLNLSSKEIATLLNVSLRGVETHRHRLRKKTGLSGDTDLTAWAMQI